MQGLHLIADLHGCAAGPLLEQAGALQPLCRRIVEDAGLTIVGELFHAFPVVEPGRPTGLTGTLLLAESHVAVHTWPERAAVTLDVYVCNLGKDNSAAAEAVVEALSRAFAPARCELQRIQRGRTDALVTELEWLTPSAVFGMQRGPLLFDERTAFQQVRVFDTPQFGRVLKVDQRFMTSEADDFFYHEALVHPAAIAHPSPRRVLIAGGGDGGAAREVLRHAGIEQVVVAELDEAVVRASARLMPTIHGGAFDDTRVQCRIGDALQTIAQAQRTGERFDLLLFDLTDPDTPASALYSEAAFAGASDCLADQGVFVVHLGSPTYHLETVVQLVERLRRRFLHVDIYGVYVPLYGCYWMMAAASHTTSVAALGLVEATRRSRERGLDDCRFWSPAQNGALFVLPAFVERALR
ncbi:hypothetical protein BH09PSE6_BH09PSE6_17760 [soil metagenome]